MRIRQVKPAFWADGLLADLPEATRLFYIGLWMVADDAGWLRWNVVEVARDLYGYETRARREKRVESMFAQLSGAGRVILHDCGHAEIPRLTEHQHLAVPSKQVLTVRREHTTCHGSPPSPAETYGDPPTPAETRASPHIYGKGNGKGNGKEKEKVNGKGSARSLAPEGATALTDEEDLPTFLRVVRPA